MATQTWLWFSFFREGFPVTLASWGFQPHSARRLLHEKAPGPKSVFYRAELLAAQAKSGPLFKKSPAGVATEKIDSLQPREGIRVSGKILRLEAESPRRDFQAY